VGVGSALPRGGVRAGFRRQVREFSSLRFFFLDVMLGGILRGASVSNLSGFAAALWRIRCGLRMLGAELRNLSVRLSLCACADWYLRAIS
jgi:hypothetical protein